MSRDKAKEILHRARPKRNADLLKSFQSETRVRSARTLTHREHELMLTWITFGFMRAVRFDETILKLL